VIAASNRPLADAVRAGAFRDDLRYRLDVVRIAVPPLRERKSDIPLLAAHFIRELNRRFQREVGGVSRGATAALMAHDFPGNVRELENLLERAYVLGARGEIVESDLPALAGPPLGAGPAATLPTVIQAERDLISLALQRYRGDKDRIAEALGISRRTLYRRLKAYGLDASPPAPRDA
jgi:DNA-binding NtrC family response regulator